jgi:Lar family restriction alleviation protein
VRGVRLLDRGLPEEHTASSYVLGRGRNKQTANTDANPEQMNNPTERDQRIAPCPFCGSEAVGVINCEEPSNEGGVAVQCEGCGASSRVHFGVKDDPVPYVINAWNERAAIQDAKQQGNDDTARLEWLCAHGTRETFDALPDYLAEAREFLDAARGVQPAAKEDTDEAYNDLARSTPRECRSPFSPRPAAQQESAPAAEQPSECVCNEHDPNCPYCAAPSLTQDKPVAASVDERQLDSLAQVVFDLDEENVLDVTRLELVEKFRYALSASSPSEQKSSLPAETRSAQEQRTEETGEAARPVVVCLCGSTRFYDAFQRANFAETMDGKIVLSVGFFAGSPEAMAREHGEGVGITPDEKLMLDDLHKRKIDLADEILVLNVGDYVGSSTQSEIDYAVAKGKRIRWLEPTVRNLSPDAPRPTRRSVAPSKSKSAASAATPKEN